MSVKSTKQYIHSRNEERLILKAKILPGKQYRLVPAANDLWEIQSIAGDVMFTGNLGECENWLDLRENKEHSQGFWSFIRELLPQSKQDL